MGYSEGRTNDEQPADQASSVKLRRQRKHW
jgi:hypothetical protein